MSLTGRPAIRDALPNGKVGIFRHHSVDDFRAGPCKDAQPDMAAVIIEDQSADSFVPFASAHHATSNDTPFGSDVMVLLPIEVSPPLDLLTVYNSSLSLLRFTIAAYSTSPRASKETPL